MSDADAVTVREGDRIQVTYRPTTHDLADQRLTFHDPETVTLTVRDITDSGRLVGEGSEGRRVTVPTGPNITSIRARPAGRDQGAFTLHLGHRRGVEVLDA